MAQQLAISWSLALVSQLAIFVLPVWILVLAPRTSSHGSDGSGNDDAMYPLMACTGLLSGCLTNLGLLCWSLYLEAGTGIKLIRIASLSTAAQGLSLALIEALLLQQQHGDRSAYQDSTLVLVCGVLSFFVSCGALMTSFYVSEARTLLRVAVEQEREFDFGTALYSLDDSDPEAAAVRAPLLGRESRDVDENGQETPGCSQPPLHIAIEDDDRSEQPIEESETPRWRGTRRLLQLARPQVVYLYAGCAILLLRLPFSLSIPHFVSTTISAVQDRNFDSALREVLCLVAAGSIDAALDFWCVFLFGYANLRIVRGVRLDLFHKLIRQEVGFFDQTSSGELSSRLQSDCSEMAGDLTWFFRFSIESVVRIAGITLYMFLRNPVLASCALSIAPVVAVVNKLYGNWLRDNAAKVQAALASANSVALEALVNVRTVIAFSTEPYESQRYEEKIQDHYRLNVKQLYMTGVYYMAISTFLINTVVQALLLYIGSRLVQADKLTASVLLAFMLYQGQLQSETLNLFQSYSSLIKSSGAGDKVFELLDRKSPAPSMNSDSVMRHLRDPPPVGSVNGRGPSPPVDSCHPVEVPPFATVRQQPCRVELKNVSFSYPSRPNQLVLNDVNLVLPPGRCLAIVGPSGCGKSTICHLLQRFYDPTSGSILVDGVDLKLLDLVAYRRSLGVVNQEASLFRGTVLENILYGCLGAERSHAVEAARMAFADEFITGFPDGYDTLIGERGVQLSGGQRQRISIARAIVKNPSLLLLDEATSALDGASEQEVQRALDRLLQERRSMTTVVIAHRVKTVQRADCIAVLQGGRIAELGSHSELMRLPSGAYRAMVDRAGASGMLSDSSPEFEGTNDTAGASPDVGSLSSIRSTARKRLRQSPLASSLGGGKDVNMDIQSTIMRLESAQHHRSDSVSPYGEPAVGGAILPHDGVIGRGLDSGPFAEYWLRHSEQMSEEEETTTARGTALTRGPASATAAAAAALLHGSRDESVDSVLDATLDSLLDDEDEEGESEADRSGR